MYIVKALTSLNDAMVYSRMISARPSDSFWAGCVKGMLAQAQSEGVITQEQALKILGSRFRVILQA